MQNIGLQERCCVAAPKNRAAAAASARSIIEVASSSIAGSLLIIQCYSAISCTHLLPQLNPNPG